MNNQKTNNTKPKRTGQIKSQDQLPQISNCQRQRILNWLQKHNLTTFQAREELGVMHPAARAQELRARGHNIVTRLRTIHTDSGTHRDVAKYVLLAGEG